MTVTDAPPPFDLKLARQAYATAAQLHGEATRRGAAALTEAHFDRLTAHDAAFVTALREGRAEDAIAADEGFHGVLVQAAGDPDLRVSVDLLSPRLRDMDRWLFTRRASCEPDNSHPGILRALHDGDAAGAAALVEASFTEAGEAVATALEQDDS